MQSHTHPRIWTQWIIGSISINQPINLANNLGLQCVKKQSLLFSCVILTKSNQFEWKLQTKLLLTTGLHRCQQRIFKKNTTYFYAVRIIGCFAWNFHSNWLLFLGVMQENKSGCFSEHSRPYIIQIRFTRHWRQKTTTTLGLHCTNDAHKSWQTVTYVCIFKILQHEHICITYVLWITFFCPQTVTVSVVWLIIYTVLSDLRVCKRFRR